MTRPEAMRLAHEMYGDGKNGWSLYAIQRYLGEHGIDVSWHTVKRWADPAFAQADREANARRTRKRLRAQRGSREVRLLDADALLRRIEELSNVGVLAPAIAAVIRLDYGVRISHHEVRTTLTTGALSPMLARRVRA